MQTPAKKIGVAKDMLHSLCIQVSDICLVEFSHVDIRFNDCCGWQVMLNGERVLFNSREHERFQLLRNGVSVTLANTNHTAPELFEGAKALLNLLDQYPSFAALAAHPKRITD